MDANAIIALACFLALQTGGLIFYAGSINRAIQDHERRIDFLETAERETSRAAAQLEAKQEAEWRFNRSRPT
jgi:DICT domain-containing protein